MALLIIDVDFFKNYNDHYGHLKGDACLQQVSKELKRVFSRSGDLVARYGGEEFAVILPKMGEEAILIADWCRQDIEALKIEHADSEVAGHLTISVGISYVIPNSQLSAGLLLDSADKGLYDAKNKGRNRTVYHACSNVAKERNGRSV